MIADGLVTPPTAAPTVLARAQLVIDVAGAAGDWDFADDSHAETRQGRHTDAAMAGDASTRSLSAGDSLLLIALGAFLLALPSLDQWLLDSAVLEGCPCRLLWTRFMGLLQIALGAVRLLWLATVSFLPLPQES